MVLFLENAPESFYYNLECKNFDYLMFSCPSLQPLKNILQINNWRDVFVSTNIARLKYVVAVIRGAYSKSSTSWKINLQTFVSWEVWKMRNTNCSSDKTTNDMLDFSNIPGYPLSGKSNVN